MKISPTTNHGKPRVRLNVQRGPYRKRLFFASYAEAVAFAQATGGPFTIAESSERHGLQHVSETLRRLHLA